MSKDRVFQVNFTVEISEDGLGVALDGLSGADTLKRVVGIALEWVINGTAEVTWREDGEEFMAEVDIHNGQPEPLYIAKMDDLAGEEGK